MQDVSLGDDAIQEGSIVDGIDLAVIILEEGQVGKEDVPIFSRNVLNQGKTYSLVVLIGHFPDSADVLHILAPAGSDFLQP